MSSTQLRLDNPVFVGRLRQFGRGTPFIHAPESRRTAQDISDIKPIAYQRAVPASVPLHSRQNRSEVLQRNILTAPAFKPIKQKPAVGQKLILAMASLVFIAGLSVAVLGFKTNKHVEAQVQAVAKQQDGEDNAIPSEEKPSEAAIRNYTVNPLLPRYVRIAKFGVVARVQREGVDKTGALKAPGNVHDAGWYENSSKPGEGGAVLLDGHVAGPTQHGVFYKIKDLKTGDLIEVERGDGQKFTYKVVKSQISDAKKLDMSSALLSATEGKQGLNLITCTGKYDSTSHEYNERIIVFAVQT